jgi:hypothetical protein
MSFKLTSNSSGPTSKQCVDLTYSSPVQVVLDHWEGNGSNSYGSLGSPDSLIFSLEPTISNSTHWDFSTTSPYYASPKHTYSSNPTWQFVFSSSTSLQICGMATVNAGGNYPSSNVRLPIDVGVLSSSLPVSWLNVEAELIDQVVHIFWQTESEFNNKSFEIERWDNNEWMVIGDISGSGSSNVVNNYSFIDNQPKKPISRYRIKQIDYDGKFSYSKVFEVFDQFLKNPIVQNPVEDYLILNSNAQFIEELKIVSLWGVEQSKIIEKDFDYTFDKGFIQIDVSRLAIGSYILMIKDKAFKFQKI